MKSLFILFIACCLQGCVDQVQLAKREMNASVLRDSPIQYQKIHTYPGDVVCGRYTTSRKAHDDRFTPFIYRDNKIDTRPSTLDVGIFCAEDSQRSLFVITGIDLKECSGGHLSKILEDFRTIESALALYVTDNGYLPRDRQGLDALINPSTIQPRPRKFKSGGYIAELPTDPWGKPYLYDGPVFGGSKGKYSLRTLGADSVAGGAAENADVDSQYLKYINHIGGCSSER